MISATTSTPVVLYIGGSGNSPEQISAALAADDAGNVYALANNSQAILQTTPSGSTSVFAANSASAFAQVSIGAPTSLAVDGLDNLYAAGTTGDLVRISAAGQVTQITSPSAANYASIFPSSTTTNENPTNTIPLAADAAGNLYVTDACSGSIQKVSLTGVVSTVTTALGVNKQTINYGDFSLPQCVSGSQGIAVDGAGNVYASDTVNNVILKITPDGVTTTLAGAAGVAGYVDGSGTTANFNAPYRLALDGNGNLYVLDGAGIVRQITPQGQVTTIAIPGNPGLAALVIAGPSLYYTTGYNTFGWELATVTGF